jgi:hypothetical protein
MVFERPLCVALGVRTTEVGGELEHGIDHQLTIPVVGGYRVAHRALAQQRSSGTCRRDGTRPDNRIGRREQAANGARAR